MATLIAFVLLTATYRLTSIQREPIVVSHLQQWLRDRATSLHYTYVACCLNADCCTLDSDTDHNIGRLPVQILALKPVVSTEVSRYFPRFLESDADILNHGRPRQLLSTPPVLIVLSSNIVLSEQLTASLIVPVGK